MTDFRDIDGITVHKGFSLVSEAVGVPFKFGDTMSVTALAPATVGVIDFAAASDGAHNNNLKTVVDILARAGIVYLNRINFKDFNLKEYISWLYQIM